MNIYHELRAVIKDLNGRPWAVPADPPHSFGCLSLVQEIYWRLKIDVPWAELAGPIDALYHLPDDWASDPESPMLFDEFLKYGEVVDLFGLRSGDLILFRLAPGEGDERIHPAVAIDGGQFIHCKRPTGVECPRLHGVYRRIFHIAFRPRAELRK